MVHQPNPADSAILQIYDKGLNKKKYSVLMPITMDVWQSSALGLFGPLVLDFYLIYISMTLQKSVKNFLLKCLESINIDQNLAGLISIYWSISKKFYPS